MTASMTMKPELESLSHAEILGLLRRARAVPKKGALVLQRHPSNPSRKDAARRDCYRVWAGNKAIIHLLVGPSLAALHQKDVAFHRNNPSISCRPLFFLRHGGLDYLGQECFGLYDLEEALASKRIDAAAWQQAVRQVASALAVTKQRSTPSRLMQELADFEQRVLAMDSFARLDQVFLRDTVFPVIRRGAGSQPLATAWSNGDFIAKNILIDEQGQARLIDYEFARRTHFAAGDWFRLGRFSNVPGTVKLADLSPEAELPPWLEILGWLEHALKISEVCAPATLVHDLPKISDRLARLVETTTQARHDSAFFSLAPAAKLMPAAAPTAAGDALTVEWSWRDFTSGFCESTITFQPQTWNEVHVDLSSSTTGRTLSTRLRLPTMPCIVELRSVEIHGRNRTDILWTIDSHKLDAVLSCTGNLLEVPTSDGLGIIHFGGESMLTLPPLRLGRLENIAGLTLWVRFVPTLVDFSRRLRQAFADGEMPGVLADGQPLGQPDSSESQRSVSAQLFIPEEGKYHEASSIHAALPEINAWTELVFDVPPLPAGAVLRYDPASQPGLLEIASLTLEPLALATASSRQIVTRAHARSWLDHLKCEGDAALTADSNGTVRVLLFGPDPILKLAPLSPELAGRPCRLCINFRYAANAPSRAWSPILQDRRNAAIDMNVRLDDVATQSEAAIAQLRDQLTNAIRAREQAKEDRADARAEADKLRAELTQLRETTDAAAQREVHQALARQLETTRQRESELAQLAARREQQTASQAAELDAVRRELSGLSTLLARQKLEREQGARALASAQQDATRREAELLAAAARHEESLVETGKQMQLLEQKHVLLVESLHAQNTHLQNLEHRASALAQERDRYVAALAKIRSRRLLRLDPTARRLLDTFAPKPTSV